MSYRVTYVFDAFNGREDEEESRIILHDMLELLARRNMRYLRDNPQTPGIFRSGVRYEQEPEGNEDWLDIPTILKWGVADCEELAAWLVAELRVRHNVPARFIIIPQWQELEQRFDYHISVWTPRGNIDPSAMLGMK